MNVKYSCISYSKMSLEEKNSLWGDTKETTKGLSITAKHKICSFFKNVFKGKDAALLTIY